jgi:hypothetical protein
LRLNERSIIEPAEKKAVEGGVAIAFDANADGMLSKYEEETGGAGPPGINRKQRLRSDFGDFSWVIVARPPRSPAGFTPEENCDEEV